MNGVWKRREGDEGGMHGTWYMSIADAMEAVGKVAVDEALDVYEGAHKTARTDATAAAETAAAETQRAEGEEDDTA